METRPEIASYSRRLALASFGQNAPPSPALMLRSHAFRPHTQVFNAPRRGVSKHEGAPLAVFILRDARTRVRICGTSSACALLRMRTSIVYCLGSFGQNDSWVRLAKMHRPLLPSC